MPRKKKTEEPINKREFFNNLLTKEFEKDDRFFLIKDFGDEDNFFLIAKKKELEGVHIQSLNIFNPREIKYKKDFLVLALLEYSTGKKVKINNPLLKSILESKSISSFSLSNGLNLDIIMRDI